MCHGAGSRKENHEIMGEQAAAAGLAALTFDFRGHGESGGEMGPDGWRDAVAAGGRLLAESGAPWLAARGASMGGTMLLLAARARPGVFSSLVLLCPADGASLLAGLDESGSVPSGLDAARERRTRRRRPQGREYSGRFDDAGAAAVPGAARPGRRGGGLPRVLLAHARDDDASPSRTASGWRTSWRRPRSSSRSRRAATTARGARPGRAGDDRLGDGDGG